MSQDAASRAVSSSVLSITDSSALTTAKYTPLVSTRKRGFEPDSCHIFARPKPSTLTSFGTTGKTIKAVHIPRLPPDVPRDAFGETFARLVSLQPVCAHLPFRDVGLLAHALMDGGCCRASALWIAMKFVGTYDYVPGPELMAKTMRMTIPELVKEEEDDLKRIEWCVGAYARKCNLIG